MTNRTTAELREAIELSEEINFDDLQDWVSAGNDTNYKIVSALMSIIKDLQSERDELSVRVAELDYLHNEIGVSDVIKAGIRMKDEVERLEAQVAALLPQPPALGGIVKEIDRHYEAAKFAPLVAEHDSDDYPERFFLADGFTSCDVTAFAELNTKYRPEESPDPRQASLAIAALVNAWPTLRANLKQEEWIEGHPPEQPEDTAWMVHRDEWRSAKITHFNRDAWYIDGNRYAPHYRFDRYCKPLPTPPQSKKEG